MDNSVKYQQLTDEAYKRNFNLITPITHLSEKALAKFVAVIEFPTTSKSKSSLSDFITENLEHIDYQLKTTGAVLIRGATGCSG